MSGGDLLAGIGRDLKQAHPDRHPHPAVRAPQTRPGPQRGVDAIVPDLPPPALRVLIKVLLDRLSFSFGGFSNLAGITDFDFEPAHAVVPRFILWPRTISYALGRPLK
jgi:hypothetical protein